MNILYIQYTVYTSPLGDLVRQFGLCFHLYTDDTQISQSFEPTDTAEAISIQQVENCVALIKS